jgi:PrcB C-terminal
MIRAMMWAMVTALAAPLAGGGHAGQQPVKGSYRMAAAGGAVKSAILREWKGFNGGLEAPAEKVIRTQQEWTTLWHQTHANQVPAPAAPKVDFTTEMVVAVFMGQRPTGGYAVTIEDVAAGKKEVRVTVREQSPPPDAITAQVITEPYHMVVVKKSALPVKFVRTAKAAPAV